MRPRSCRMRPQPARRRPVAIFAGHTFRNFKRASALLRRRIHRVARQALRRFFAVCAARKSTGRVVCFAPRREKPNARYLQRTSLPVVCRRFSTPFRAAHLLENMPGAFRARRGALIFADLRAIQLRYGFLPKAELEGLSQRTQTPLYKIHSVASFYPHFHLVPPPK